MIKMQGERLLIELKDQGESTTDSGIIIPGIVAEEGSKEGTIALAGEDSKYKVGQYVWITKFAGEVTPDGRMAIDDADVLAVIE